MLFSENNLQSKLVCRRIKVWIYFLAWETKKNITFKWNRSRNRTLWLSQCNRSDYEYQKNECPNKYFLNLTLESQEFFLCAFSCFAIVIFQIFPVTLRITKYTNVNICHWKQSERALEKQSPTKPFTIYIDYAVIQKEEDKTVVEQNALRDQITQRITCISAIIPLFLNINVLIIIYRVCSRILG